MKIPKEISEFLSKEKFCVIATCDEKPEAATMASTFDNGEVLLFTSKSTRKYKNLIRNKNVALVFSFSDHSKNAQIDGEASLSNSSSVKERIIKINPMVKSHIESEEHGENVFLVIKPKRIYFVDYSQKPIKEVLIE